MTIIEMLGQSGLLTLLGMGVVFTFLIILILSMTLLHKVIHALGLDKEEKVDAPKTSAPAQTQDDSVIAAIAAAVRTKLNN